MAIPGLGSVTPLEKIPKGRLYIEKSEFTEIGKKVERFITGVLLFIRRQIWDLLLFLNQNIIRVTETFFRFLFNHIKI